MVSARALFIFWIWIVPDILNSDTNLNSNCWIWIVPWIVTRDFWICNLNFRIFSARSALVPLYWYPSRGYYNLNLREFQYFVKIEKLHYLNLEVNTGKTVSTKENINIRCRINSSEEHIWHTSHSQINLIVDLIHNF